MREPEQSNESGQLETDLTKALALKKLTLEIAELQRPWWKRPNYILAALPTLLALVALLVGLLNGFFSAQLTKLENQRHDLQAQVRDFEIKRDALNAENDTLKSEKTAMTKELITLAKQAELAKEELGSSYDAWLRCRRELTQLRLK